MRTLAVASADSHGQSTRLTIILCSQHVVVIIVATVQILDMKIGRLSWPVSLYHHLHGHKIFNSEYWLLLE